MLRPTHTLSSMPFSRLLGLSLTVTQQISEVNMMQNHFYELEKRHAQIMQQYVSLVTPSSVVTLHLYSPFYHMAHIILFPP